MWVFVQGKPQIQYLLGFLIFVITPDQEILL
jgi:hypothetical protein